MVAAAKAIAIIAIQTLDFLSPDWRPVVDDSCTVNFSAY
jgi:hypothetical protein